MTLSDSAGILLATIGVCFMLISAIGLLRLPNIFARMHAAGIAATVGVSCLLLGAGLYFAESHLSLRMAALTVLIVCTAPIATTAIARAAYRRSARGDAIDPQIQLRIDEMAPQAPADDMPAGGHASGISEPASHTIESINQPPNPS